VTFGADDFFRAPGRLLCNTASAVCSSATMEKDQHALSLDDVDEESQVIRPMDVLCGRGKVDHGRSQRFHGYFFNQNSFPIYVANNISYFLFSDLRSIDRPTLAMKFSEFFVCRRDDSQLETRAFDKQSQRG
jgi:hypothetical protein